MDGKNKNKNKNKNNLIHFMNYMNYAPSKGLNKTSSDLKYGFSTFENKNEIIIKKQKDQLEPGNNTITNKINKIKNFKNLKNNDDWKIEKNKILPEFKKRTNSRNKKEFVLKKDLLIKELMQKQSSSSSNFNNISKIKLNKQNENKSICKPTNVFFKLNESGSAGHGLRLISNNTIKDNSYCFFNYYNNLLKRDSNNGYRDNQQIKKMFLKESVYFKTNLQAFMPNKSTMNFLFNKSRNKTLNKEKKLVDDFNTAKSFKIKNIDDNYKYILNKLKNTNCNSMCVGTDKIPEIKKFMPVRQFNQIRINKINLNPNNIFQNFRVVKKLLRNESNFNINESIKDIVIKTIDNFHVNTVDELLNNEFLKYNSNNSRDSSQNNKNNESSTKKYKHKQIINMKNENQFIINKYNSKSTKLVIPLISNEIYESLETPPTIKQTNTNNNKSKICKKIIFSKLKD